MPQLLNPRAHKRILGGMGAKIATQTSQILYHNEKIARRPSLPKDEGLTSSPAHRLFCKRPSRGSHHGRRGVEHVSRNKYRRPCYARFLCNTLLRYSSRCKSIFTLVGGCPMQRPWCVSYFLPMACFSSLYTVHVQQNCNVVL